jgi:hypothetical protein
MNVGPCSIKTIAPHFQVFNVFQRKSWPACYSFTGLIGKLLEGSKVLFLPSGLDGFVPEEITTIHPGNALELGDHTLEKGAFVWDEGHAVFGGPLYPLQGIDNTLDAWMGKELNSNASRPVNKQVT